jgi:hypothetical protein
VSDGVAGGQVVGIDLHLHRSVIARIDGQVTELGWVRIDNDPAALRAECRKVHIRASSTDGTASRRTTVAAASPWRRLAWLRARSCLSRASLLAGPQ